MEPVKRESCSHKGPGKDSEAIKSPEESTGGEGSRFGLSKLVLVLPLPIRHLSFWTGILSFLPQFPF